MQFPSWPLSSWLQGADWCQPSLEHVARASWSSLRAPWLIFLPKRFGAGDFFGSSWRDGSGSMSDLLVHAWVDWVLKLDLEFTIGLVCLKILFLFSPRLLDWQGQGTKWQQKRNHFSFSALDTLVKIIDQERPFLVLIASLTIFSSWRIWKGQGASGLPWSHHDQLCGLRQAT